MNNTFEKIIIFKKIPYWLYWTIIGVCGFLTSEILLFYFEENLYFYSMITVSFALAIVPIYNIWISYKFRELINEVEKSLWDKKISKNKASLYDINIIEIFSLKSPPSKLVTILVVIFGVLTILYLGLPFTSPAINIIGFTAFLLILWFCGQTLYITFALYFSLSKIVSHPVNIPFMFIPNPTISKLQGFYSTMSLAITFLYSLLVTAIWNGPYGLHPILLIWLTLLASYSVVMFIWSFFQIHNLLQKIKYAHVEVINNQIQKTLNAINKNNLLSNIEHLERLIKIQKDVQQINEYPLALSSGITFVITILAAIAQIIVSIRQIFS